MRLVLDTNIIVSGLIWGGVPRQLLELGRDGQATFFTSSVLLDELADVLEREKFTALLASQNVTPAFLMQRYGMLARLVNPQPIERTVRDMDDDAVIATALAAKANVIATGDSDLLVLHPWQGIQILNAADAVEFVQNDSKRQRRK
ncbi:putative toxin-antitoxin system toxin component, PIN family [Thiolapillus sp.]|uniref:putative toxin-antitoxin system toxin component, PIN family n=3 Tax=Thiolapillus sp. TaxID=2017437 RepID=UPI0025E0CBD4|nr:putative toxin-antitoxin system toxin component, PIN family [Thiolapillus sp.]